MQPGLTMVRSLIFLFFFLIIYVGHSFKDKLKSTKVKKKEFEFAKYSPVSIATANFPDNRW